MSSESRASAEGHLFIEGVDQLDIAYWQQGVWGGSYEVDLEVWGVLDHQGFVCDFSELKALFRALLKKSFDHRFVAPTQHAHYQLSCESEEVMCWHAREGGREEEHVWWYRAPSSAFLPLLSSSYRSDLLAADIQAAALAELRKQKSVEGLKGLKVALREQASVAHPPHFSPSTFFPYTHGITSHRGLCHRLWHGHFSRLEVQRDGVRYGEIERALASQLLGGGPVHIADPDQIQRPSLWPAGERGPEGELCELAYRGASGIFQCRMPAHRVFLSTPAPSVECLAVNFAEALKKKAPQHRYNVKVYEGLHKGGICSR